MVKDRNFRDGTSQSDRKLDALSPNYVSVEQRGSIDLLEFAKGFSKRVSFDSFLDKNREELMEILEFSRNPESFKNNLEKFANYSKPHLALFLAFLRLLEYPKLQFNELTLKHMDYYYRKVLRLKERAEIPDQVHVMLELTKGVNEYFLPRGTLFAAGKDNLGMDLRYASDRDIVLNKAKIANIKRTCIKKIPLFKNVYLKERQKKNFYDLYKELICVALKTPDLPVSPKGAIDFVDVCNHPENYLEYITTALFFASQDVFKETFEKLKGLKTADAPEFTFIADILNNVLVSHTKSELNAKYSEVPFEKKFSAMINAEFFTNLGLSPKLPDDYKNLDEIAKIISEYSTNTETKKKLRDYIYEQLYFNVPAFIQLIDLKQRIVEKTKNKAAGERIIAEELDDLYGLVIQALLEKTKFLEVTKGIYSDTVFDADKSTAISAFKTFPKSTIVDDPTENIGIVGISSPILLLKGGARKIIITFYFNEQKKITILNPCEVYLSEKNGWFALKDKVTPEIINNKSFKLTFALRKSEPEVVCSENLGLDAKWPTVKIVFHNDDYDAFKSIYIQKIDVNVEVSELANIKMRNDSYIIDPKSPFKLFGEQAQIGGGFYFTNQEIATKKLDDLKIDWEWATTYPSISDKESAKKLPDMEKRYKAYLTVIEESAITNDNFKIRLKFFDNGCWVNLSKQDAALFTSSLDYITEIFSQQKYQDIPFNENTLDPFECQSYYKIELNGHSFLYDIYPLVLKEKAGKTDIVYSPYSPEIQSVNISYKASCSIDFYSSKCEDLVIDFFHFYPFGARKISNIEALDNKNYILPVYDKEGYLNIGLKNITPTETVSILLQMAQYNREKVADIAWSYLAEENKYRAFDNAEIIFDETKGLENTGIIRFKLPEDASCANSIMPNNLYWLQATCESNAELTPYIVDVKTQALKAIYLNKNNSSDHLNSALPKNSITKLAISNQNIKEVSQPYPSFAGKAKEDIELFPIRISELLRHRQRAVTRLDYEHLILENFTDIYKVKCISRAELKNAGIAANAGEAAIVVIPKIFYTGNTYVQTLPIASLSLLDSVSQYLKQHTSPFIKITIKNPVYEQVKIRLNVKFKAGYDDEIYYKNELNKSVIGFISPWAYGESSDISFGTCIYKSNIINHIENLPYIEYVDNFRFISKTIINSNGTLGKETMCLNSDMVSTTYPDSILVSAPIHVIENIKAPLHSGIGYMIVDLDFIVGSVDSSNNKNEKI